MKESLAPRFLVALVLASCLGCEWIGGLEQRTVWVDSSDAGTGDAQPDRDATAPPGCSLPTEGDATVRMGNLVPSSARVDLCFVPADGTAATDVVPVLRGSGADCPSGLGYREISAPLQLPTGSYVVHAVESTSDSCDGPSLTSVNAQIDDETVLDFYLLGDGVSPPTLKVFRESRPSIAARSVVRVIHAAHEEGPVDIAFATSPTLPATMDELLFAGVAYGGPATAESVGEYGKIDANGYLTMQIGGGVLPFGAAPVGVDEVRVPCRAKVPLNDATTLYLIGKDGDPDFPLEMFGCRETSDRGVLAECGAAAPVDLKVAMYQTYLNGVWAMEEPRRQYLRQVVPEIDADVLFLSDVWSDADKQAFIEGAKESFPYSAFAATDLTTPFNDPRGADGNVPAPYEEAPCAPLPTESKATLDCLRDNCTEEATESSTLITRDTTSCMTGSCALEVFSVAAGDGVCGNCLLTFLQSYLTIGETRTQCETNPMARFAYVGKTGMLILSKYPLEDVEYNLLPSTTWRSAVLAATITVAESTQIDVYGGNTTYYAEDCFTHPYTGNYGDGSTCPEAYLHEQMLQANRIVAWIDERTTRFRRPAIIALDTDTGISYGQELTERNPEVFSIFDAAMGRAVARDYQPACTYCGDNPLVTPPGSTTTAESTWTQHLFVQSIPITSVRSTGRFLTDAIYDQDDGENSYKIPPSYYYGLRSVVRIQP